MEETEADVMEISPPSPRLIARRTRSQAAPEWTAQEMLTLANEVAAVEEDCRRSLSSFQRWEIVATNCSAILGGVPRSANHCRHRWNAMVADYRQIQAWEGVEKKKKGSYWSLGSEERRVAWLPVCFDREVFEAITRSLGEQELGAEADDVASESEQQPGEGVEEEEEDDVVMVKEMSGSRKATQTKSRGGKTAETTMQGMACQLQDNAQRIHAILSDQGAATAAGKEPPPHPAATDLTQLSPVGMELRRRQADELIKALASLISSIQHLAELAGEEEQLVACWQVANGGP